VPKKLIEVALPLDAINAASAREKSIRHGHPSTLHLWWARRPLAACRAVLFAQLVDDPSAHPELFPTEADQEVERKRLFDLIERLVPWEASTDADVLKEAHAEIARCFPEGLPTVLDPFCGGGSIPLEAQRLGLTAEASDLNPVAVLITKALIEIPPRWAGRPPVHPQAEQRMGWTGAQGLAEDVRRYGADIRAEAQRRIGQHYPEAALPGGGTAPVIAWLWTRTVPCPNPACGATMPLVRSFWLSKNKARPTWVKPVVEGKQVRFEIGYGAAGPATDGTKVGRGAKFRCLVCDEVSPDAHVKSSGRDGRMGTQLMAIVAEGHRQRVYIAPTAQHVRAAALEGPHGVFEAKLTDNARWFSPPAYGMTTHTDLYTARQLLALTTFSDLVRELVPTIEADARAAGLHLDEATMYARDVATHLACTASALADDTSTICTWRSGHGTGATRSTFARQALPMTWDFAEAGLFSHAAGDFETCLTAICRVISRAPAHEVARVTAADAARRPYAAAVICTDPPYYDNIGYADLADFFYVWLRRTLRDVYPELLSTMLTPKGPELVATPYRFEGSRERADQHFESGFRRAFSHMRTGLTADVPLTVFYAFKQAEGDETDVGVVSTGWETLLDGLLSSGLTVTATWPVRTERGSRSTGIGTNALASSIVLACRPRADNAGITDRRGFQQRLRAELPQALRLLQSGNVAPVDLAQASIGPGMGVFSAYAKVVEPDGSPMRVRAALGLINQVLAEVLNETEGEFDPQTRWAIRWFEQQGMAAGPYGQAEVLATANAVAVSGLVDSGVLASTRGLVRLLTLAELPEDWDPSEDARTPVWEATQHLIKRHESAGVAAAGALLRGIGGLGDTVRDLAYLLYSVCERKGWAREALAYNALIVAWPEIAEAARRGPDAGAGEQDRLL